MKRILVATDLSARSDRAIDRAHLLAIDLKARLVIVHVIDDELPSGLRKVHSELAVDNIRANIAHLRPRMGARPHILIQYGKPYREILDVAGNADAF